MKHDYKLLTIYSLTFVLFHLLIVFLSWKVAWGFGLLFLFAKYDPYGQVKLKKIK